MSEGTRKENNKEGLQQGRNASGPQNEGQRSERNMENVWAQSSQKADSAWPRPDMEGNHGMRPEITPRRRNPALKILGTLFGAFFLCGIGGYVGMSYFYSDKFFPGTKINSFNCGDMTVEEAESLIRNKVEEYSLEVSSRNFDPQTITAEQIGYKYQSDGTVEQILKEQNPLLWVEGYIWKRSYSVGENIVYDKEKVKTALESLECMKPENQIQPEDAYIEFQDTLFTIVPGSEGAAIDEEKALELLYAAIESTEESVNLEKGGAYLEPNVREDDEGLIDRLKIVNTYAKASITHEFGTESELLDSRTFKDWYSRDEKGDLYLDGDVLRSKLTTYVADLAARYDTLGSTRTFRATSGRTVQVSGGNYGWKINQSEEVEKMYNEILNGEKVSREPVYSSYGSLRRDGSDIGSSYIEVDLSEQHLYVYKDGVSVLDSDFVSGRMTSDDRKTPAGVCHLTFKTKDFTLRGKQNPDGSYEYEEPVSYWMPFNGGVGFHDAPWRSEFGGDIYKTGGSHGCINMPIDKAAELYEIIDESIPIVVFY